MAQNKYWVTYNDGKDHRFAFNTESARDAFMEGVEWVNDSDINLIDSGERNQTNTGACG